MIQANITTFMDWFINQIVNIFTWMTGQLDNIQIYGNVTLLDFTITITIIGIFITIILTLPQNANRMSSRAERNRRKENKNDK